MSAAQRLAEAGAAKAAQATGAAFGNPSMNKKAKQLEDPTIMQDGENAGPLLSYFGTAVDNTEDTLKAGNRGPTLLEDFHVREKVSHFDHERIPERVVHARGAGAFGTFTLTKPLSEDVTVAPVLNDATRVTPTFVRFSTVLGSRGSADTVRDVRGFATRFYTEEGNWDIVGNNIPVFFIQDGIEFPDIIHAGKPEPHNEIPQGQSAHDNFWDFMSLKEETTAMTLWLMSDRAIPRSFRTMEGFGVNTFVLVGKGGRRTFVKFHWRPRQGIHSLVWDEALKLAGQDPDFHRRDLYTAIEAGAYPQWELGVQLVPEEDEHKFDFDLLDDTKFIPEEQVPVQYIGVMELNRNPDEFFSETEQIAFCTQHIVPGIDYSADPMLTVRNFSYQDTQLTRLGGPNFSTIPINRPLKCPVTNYLRDGFHQDAVYKGKINYYPSRAHIKGGGYRPTPPDKGGATFSRVKVEGVRERARGPKFNEHFNQPQMFYNSLSPVEQAHLISALGFELGHVDDRGVHERMVARYNELDHNLAVAVASQVGLKAPAPSRQNKGQKTAYWSQLEGKRQTWTAKGRKVGIFVLDGVDGKQVKAIQMALHDAGVMEALIGPRKGPVAPKGVSLDDKDEVIPMTDFNIEGCRSTYFDALILPRGEGERYDNLAKNGRLVHFVREAYGHLKPVGVLGPHNVSWLKTVVLAGVSAGNMPDEGEAKAKGWSIDKGVLLGAEVDKNQWSAYDAFIDQVARHRVWDRDASEVAF